MKYILILLSTVFITACQNEKPQNEKEISGAAILHKNLYEQNHKIMQGMTNRQMSKTDSSYLKLAEHIDLVTLAVIEESGGQNAGSGDLMHPNDRAMWIEALKEINFSKNWKLGVNKIDGLSPSQKETFINEGLKKIDSAIDTKMSLDRFCIELRVIQLTVIGYWIESS